jgi:GNAT superfamily N-acetyltransferase
VLIRRARGEADLQRVHRLNYDTFVREIPQHPDDGSGRLIDKFHPKNVYYIALSGERLVGMVCVNDRPPFSITDRLPGRALLDRLAGPLLEIRLLAVLPRWRRTGLFSALGWRVLRHARDGGHSHLLISGFEHRRRMYERMGFVALGPAVPSGGARFIPMAVELRRAPDRVVRLADRIGRRLAAADVTRPVP